MIEFYSGGASGADSLWENEIENLNIDCNFYIISFSTHSYITSGFGKVIDISESDLDLVNQYYKNACSNLNRHESNRSQTRNLLRRNFYQVLDADCVVAMLDKNPKDYIGGTSYAFEYAKELNTPIYAFYDDVLYQSAGSAWVKCSVEHQNFNQYNSFALIGSRKVRISDMKRKNVQLFLKTLKGRK